MIPPFIHREAPVEKTAQELKAELLQNLSFFLGGKTKSTDLFFQICTIKELLKRYLKAQNISAEELEWIIQMDEEAKKIGGFLSSFKIMHPSKYMETDFYKFLSENSNLIAQTLRIKQFFDAENKEEESEEIQNLVFLLRSKFQGVKNF